MNIEVGQIWEDPKYGWIRIVTIISNDFLYYTDILGPDSIYEYQGCNITSFKAWIRRVNAVLIRKDEIKTNPFLQYFADIITKK